MNSEINRYYFGKTCEFNTRLITCFNIEERINFIHNGLHYEPALGLDNK